MNNEIKEFIEKINYKVYNSSNFKVVQSHIVSNQDKN